MFSAVSYGQTQKKVLLIGVDGLRADAMETAATPNIDALIANGTYSRNATTSDLTFSGPGWTDILFGIHRNQHDVATNSTSQNPNNNSFEIFSNSQQHNHNDLLAIANFSNPNLQTARWTTWSPLHTTRTPGGSDYAFFHHYGNGGDSIATADAAGFLSNSSNSADVNFFYFADVDVVGHGNGFHPNVNAYRSEIESTDALIGNLINAVQNRSTYASEDWLFVLTSDHGGSINGGHAGNAPWSREVPLIISGNSVKNQSLGWDAKTVDVVPTALTHLGINGPSNLVGHVIGLNGSTDPRPTIGFGKNLIFNGDAEYDDGFVQHGMDQKVTGWNEFPDADFQAETSQRFGDRSFTVIEYGAPSGFPSVGEAPPDGGENFFSGTSQIGQIAGGGTAIMQQTIDVSSLSDHIDGGYVDYEISAFLGGFSSQDDKADFIARFLASDGTTVLDTVSLIGPDAFERGNQTGFLFREDFGDLVPGTRFIELELVTFGNDGYADNLRFVLSSSIPEPGSTILIGFIALFALKRRVRT